jgi:DNA invertase Pin-like site-specific DNA recombinase
VRVLIAARLSVLAEGQSGLDTQEQEVVRWAEQGHTVVDVVKDHKSGKLCLWDRPHLAPWVLKRELIDQYDAIVALRVDRLTRADHEGTTRMEAWAREHDKQLLISSAEVRFPSEGNEGGMWDLYLRMAHQERLAIQERYGRMQRHKIATESLVGRPPWGYEVGPGLNDYGQPIKTIVPTEDGRRWVPAIYEKIIGGMSLMDAAVWLTLHGVKPTGGYEWSQTSLSQMIHNPVYTGTRRADGKVMVNADVDTMPCECHQGRYVRATRVPKVVPQFGVLGPRQAETDETVVALVP